MFAKTTFLQPYKTHSVLDMFAKSEILQPFEKRSFSNMHPEITKWDCIYAEPIGRYVVVAERDSLVVRVQIASSETSVVSTIQGPNEREDLDVARKLREYFEGHIQEFEEVRVDLSGLPYFSMCVLDEVRKIPVGDVLTYGEIAAKAGRPQSPRAVGGVLSRNPVPIIIPCHRITAASGIGGYSSGKGIKKLLLEHERKMVTG